MSVHRSLQAVLFDWGGTLMREIPGLDGPMAYWPRVEALPGAEDTLRALHGRYTLGVATNAVASDAALVRTALKRVALDRYFTVILTARDLGVAKPDLRFFAAAVEELGLPPEKVAMVGDAYSADIVGATTAGLRAIWFNPASTPCPLVHPVHDAEIRTLTKLPPLLAQPFLPNGGECLRILREHAVPENVVQHSLAVAAAAHHLAVRLRERGVAVDPLLVHRGAMLHDLDKVSSEKPTEHGMRAGRILRELGWPALAGIAERHVLGAVPTTWEEKLVHYADKIVDEDRVVGLVERVTSLACRYSAQGEQIARALPALLSLEAEILGRIGIPAAELLAELGQLDVELPPFVSPAHTPYDRTG